MNVLKLLLILRNDLFLVNQVNADGFLGLIAHLANGVEHARIVELIEGLVDLSGGVLLGRNLNSFWVRGGEGRQDALLNACVR